MTDARVKSERRNKVKLRGQKIPGITWPERFPLLETVTILEKKKKKQKRRRRKKGNLKRKRNQANHLLLESTWSTRLPRKAGNSILLETVLQNSRPVTLLPSKDKMGSERMTTGSSFLFKGRE